MTATLDRCNEQQEGPGLWMRPAYRNDFLKITTVVRRKDRSDPSDPTFIPLGMDIPVRFITVIGNQCAGIQAKLFPDDGTTVRLTHRIVKPIRELTTDDLAGGTPDIATPELVRWNLAMIDNTPLPGMDELVTVYHLEHRPRVT